MNQRANRWQKRRISTKLFRAQFSFYLNRMICLSYLKIGSFGGEIGFLNKIFLHFKFRFSAVLVRLVRVGGLLMQARCRISRQPEAPRYHSVMNLPTNEIFQQERNIYMALVITKFQTKLKKLTESLGVKISKNLAHPLD